MIVPYIRSSSYNNWDFCAHQYFITYVLGWLSDNLKKTEIGTVVHKALETLALLKLESQKGLSTLSLEDEALGHINVDFDDLLKDSIVEQMLDLSYSYYTAQSKHDWTKNDRKECLQLCFDALQFNDGQFDPRYRNLIAAEPHFDIPIEEDWAKFSDLVDGKWVTGQLAIKGTIDLVTKLDDDTIEVIDWKTGQRKNWATGEIKDLDYLKKDPQLLLYYYALSKLYPEYKYAMMSIFFIREKNLKTDRGDIVQNKGIFSLCYDESDRKMFLRMLRERFLEIRQSNKPKLLDPRRKDWRCTRLCHYYKNNWPGTNKNMCMYIEEQLKKNGMEKTVASCTRPGFSANQYQNPGE